MKTGKITNSTGHSSVAGQVKRVVRLNIGLNNNPYDAVDIIWIIGKYFDVDRTMIVNGEYNGEEEPTLVVVGLTTHSHGVVETFVRAMCRVFTQDCIPYKMGSKGELVYHPSYDGDRYDFDEQYFITI